MDGAGGRPQLSGDQLNNGGFSGSGGAHQKAKLSVVNPHGNAVEGPVALLVAFHHIYKFNHLHLSPVDIPQRGPIALLHAM